MICAYCKKCEATGGPGPSDACGGCKLEMYFIGRLTSELTPAMAHVIMGAINLTDSEGVSYIADGVTDNLDKVEFEVVRLLYRVHPDVVRHERYACIPSVIEVLR